MLRRRIKPGCSKIFEDPRKAVLTESKTNDSQRKKMVGPRAIKAVSGSERTVTELIC